MVCEILYAITGVCIVTGSQLVSGISRHKSPIRKQHLGSNQTLPLNNWIIISTLILHPFSTYSSHRWPYLAWHRNVPKVDYLPGERQAAININFVSDFTIRWTIPSSVKGKNNWHLHWYHIRLATLRHSPSTSKEFGHIKSVLRTTPSWIQLYSVYQAFWTCEDGAGKFGWDNAVPNISRSRSYNIKWPVCRRCLDSCILPPPSRKASQSHCDSVGIIRPSLNNKAVQEGVSGIYEDLNVLQSKQLDITTWNYFFKQMLEFQIKWFHGTDP